MVMATDRRWDIGQQGRAIFEHYPTKEPQPFVVVRAVTIVEWRAWLAESGALATAQEIADTAARATFFYEIVTD